MGIISPGLRSWVKRRRWTQPQHSPLCVSWLVWPAVFQHRSMDADEVPLRVLFIRSSLLIHLGMFTWSQPLWRVSFLVENVQVSRAPRGQRKMSLLTVWGLTYCLCLTKSQEAVLNSVRVPTVLLNNRAQTCGQQHKERHCCGLQCRRGSVLTEVLSGWLPQCHRDSRVLLRLCIPEIARQRGREQGD